MMYMYVLWSDQKLEVDKAWESLLHRPLSRDLDQDSCSPPLIISQVAYTFLMYVEFGIGDWLEPRPFLYGLVHQVRGVGVQCVCSLVCSVCVASFPGLHHPQHQSALFLQTASDQKLEAAKALGARLVCVSMCGEWIAKLNLPTLQLNPWPVIDIANARLTELLK